MARPRKIINSTVFTNEQIEEFAACIFGAIREDYLKSLEDVNVDNDEFCNEKAA